MGMLLQDGKIVFQAEKVIPGWKGGSRMERLIRMERLYQAGKVVP